jgi:hypothetical protein
MGMLRISGWDCVVKRNSDNKEFNNWASNSNGHYLPTFRKNYIERELYMFDHTRMVRRNHNWLRLPYFGTEFTMDMSMNYQTFKIYYDRNEILTPATLYVQRQYNMSTAIRQIDGQKVAYAEYKFDIPKKLQDFQDFKILAAAEGMEAVATTLALDAPMEQVNLEQLDVTE